MKRCDFDWSEERIFLKVGFLLMTVLQQDLTLSNNSLPVTKDTVTVFQAILVAFF